MLTNTSVKLATIPRIQLQLIFILSLILLTVFAKGQQENFTDFGKPDMKELLMRECSFDKGASALKLLDFQQSEVLIDYNTIKIQTERRVRIKIFNENGFEFASIVIPYVGRKREAKIKDISAYVFNLDATGKVVVRKIEKKQVFREKADGGVKKVVFTFPDLHPGSVIEYRYTKIERDRLHFEPWFFQDRMPTLVSSCRIIRPSIVPIDQRFITVDSVEKKFERKKGDYNNYSTYYSTFTLRNVTAFRLEPMMSSIKDNLQRIEFAMTPTGFSGIPVSFKSWDFFNELLLRSPYLGKAITTTITGTDYILDSTKKIKDTAEKINYIFQEIKRKLKWDDDQTFYAEDINDAWKTNTASSAEMNLVLLNLFRKSGIPCYPLLVSTRNNGKTDREFMSLSQFNGVDVVVFTESKVYILDATQEYQSYLTPPFNILNREAFLIDTSLSQWVHVSDNRPLFKNVLSALVEVNNEGLIDGNAVSFYYDFAKSEKLNYKPEEQDREEEEKKFIEKESAEIKIDSLKEENAEDELKPLTDHFHFTGKLSNTDDYFFIDPLFLSSFRKNPFNDSIRNTDVDFGSNQYYNISITVKTPEGFVLDHMPPNQMLRSIDSSILFKRTYFYENNTLVLRHIFEVRKPVYEKAEYTTLKEFFHKMYGMINEQIVLKRK